MNQIYYEDIISSENLFSAWETFRKGKRQRRDVQLYERYLEDNIFKLHNELKNQRYKHDRYKAFFVNDPKQRHIHKATVNDRLVHQALYSALYPVFDQSFIYSSYSCRLNKGTHKAVARLQTFLRKESKNYTTNCCVLKCDIRKFFASVDKDVLLSVIKKKVNDKPTLWLISEILDSFSPGLPLGNLTSQIFANVYLNELDQYIKHKLRIKYYIRYCDDFVIIHQDKENLHSLIETIDDYLKTELNMRLHPRKVNIRRFSWGIDFLGYIVLPHYILPRTKTKRRLIKKLMQKTGKVKKRGITQESFNQSLQSYLGYLQHANTHNFKQKILNEIYFYGF